MLKHNENLEKKEKVKYDLYKILRMSILLNQNEVDKVTLDKFKEASLNIDKMLGEEYEEKLDSMFYDTESLEEEEKRLKDLVAFITDRIEKRKNLLEDYRSVTNRELNDLEYINKSGDLDLYEKRLKTIKEYLDNSKLIEVNEHDLEILKEELVKEYDIKSSNELKNTKLEDTLFNAFINALYEMDLYSSLELDNIDDELQDLQKEIIETCDQKDTFTTAFDNLKASGISGDLELEYAAYVENAKRNYYYVKEKEIILKLYKLIEEKESEYSNLYIKREKVKDLLQERILLRKELGIKDQDLMSKVFDLLDDQKQEIDSEKENVDNINILTERIKLKENRLEELHNLIKKPEVLSILKEYALIDTYDNEYVFEETDEEIEEYENISLEEAEEDNEEDNEEPAMNLLKDLLTEDEAEELEQEEKIEEEIITEEEISEEQPDEEFTFEEEQPKQEYKPNQIKESLVVPTMNFGLSRLKSISVMKRVGDMLGVNAKKAPEVVEVPKEEFVSSEPESVQVEERQEETIPPIKEQKEELFWTPNEFAEIKAETEPVNNTDEDIFINNSINTVNESPIFEFKMPEIKEETKDNQIFENQNNNGLIFTEHVIPELVAIEVLPENKEEKFMWPNNMETFDINGIFPN